MSGLTQSFDNLIGQAVQNVNAMLSGNVGQVIVFVVAIGLLFLIYRYAKGAK